MVEDNEQSVLGTVAEIQKFDSALIEEMMKAGLHLGMRSSKTHPRMKQFLAGVRNGITVIDLLETARLLEAAWEFVKSVVAKKGVILLVGTTPPVKKAVEAEAKDLGFPYVVERWLGGTLTNFKTISKRIAYFKKLKSDKEAGRWDKYTKKERLNFDREIAKMSLMFSGLENLAAPPDALVVVDVNAHSTAVREARRLKIPMVGFLNTDTDPELVNYPVPANSRSKSSIDWILAQLTKVVAEAKSNSQLTINN